jgi:hypothetical protein
MGPLSLLVERLPADASQPAGDSPVLKAKKASPIVTLDQRNTKERRAAPRRQKTVAAPVERRVVAEPRREKVNRRRQIDPTTCERDYTNDEVEFMHALDRYKRTSGRMFPTCSEVLEVIRDLGYAKVSPTATADIAPAAETKSSATASVATGPEQDQ